MTIMTIKNKHTKRKYEGQRCFPSGFILCGDRPYTLSVLPNNSWHDDSATDYDREIDANKNGANLPVSIYCTVKDVCGRKILVVYCETKQELTMTS